jgi:hypothetical protein
MVAARVVVAEVNLPQKAKVLRAALEDRQMALEGQAALALLVTVVAAVVVGVLQAALVRGVVPEVRGALLYKEIRV